MPRMWQADSTNVLGVGYDPETGDLTVAYRSGGRYRYAQVEPLTFARLMAAESTGGYLAREIKPIYPCTKLPTEGAEAE